MSGSRAKAKTLPARLRLADFDASLDGAPAEERHRRKRSKSYADQLDIWSPEAWHPPQQRTGAASTEADKPSAVRPDAADFSVGPVSPDMPVPACGVVPPMSPPNLSPSCLSPTGSDTCFDLLVRLTNPEDVGSSSSAPPQEFNPEYLVAMMGGAPGPSGSSTQPADTSSGSTSCTSPINEELRRAHLGEILPIAPEGPVAAPTPSPIDPLLCVAPAVPSLDDLPLPQVAPLGPPSVAPTLARAAASLGLGAAAPSTTPPWYPLAPSPSEAQQPPPQRALGHGSATKPLDAASPTAAFPHAAAALPPRAVAVAPCCGSVLPPSAGPAPSSSSGMFAVAPAAAQSLHAPRMQYQGVANEPWAPAFAQPLRAAPPRVTAPPQTLYVQPPPQAQAPSQQLPRPLYQPPPPPQQPQWQQQHHQAPSLPPPPPQQQPRPLEPSRPPSQQWHQFQPAHLPQQPPPPLAPAHDKWLMRQPMRPLAPATAEPHNHMTQWQQPPPPQQQHLHQQQQHAIGGGSGRNLAERLSWSAQDDARIVASVREHGFKWRLIASFFEGRSDDSVRNRYNRVKDLPEHNQDGVPQPQPPPKPPPKAPKAAASAAGGAGNKTSRKAAMTIADPNLNDDDKLPERVSWSCQEDETIMRSVEELGNKWHRIAQRLPGRTEHAIRNRYSRLQSLASRGKPIILGTAEGEPIGIQLIPQHL